MKEAVRALGAGFLLLLSACGGGGDAGVSVFDYVAKQQGQVPRLVPSVEMPVVRYTVDGTAKEAGLTYRDAAGALRQPTVLLPWVLEFNGKANASLYLSAQNQAEEGTVRVLIEVNNIQVQQGVSSDAYGIATAAGTCC